MVYFGGQICCYSDPRKKAPFYKKIEGFMLTLVCIGLSSKAQAEKQANKQTRKQIIKILDP